MAPPLRTTTMTTEATTTITTTTAAVAAAERGRTIRLFVDDATDRVVLAEADEDVVAFILSVRADPRAAVEDMLRQDPAFAALGCYANFSAFESLLPRSGATSSIVPVLPQAAARPASRPAGKAGRGIMAWRLFRCDHLGCRCSDVTSRTPGSACPCAPCAAGGGAKGRRDTELHFLEASFYRRPNGTAVIYGRGAGRSGDTFYRCRARNPDFLACRYRVTDERGVRCPLCQGFTTVEVKCAKGDDSGGEPSAGSESLCRYAILDDLTVRLLVIAGISGAALLFAAGVTADPATVREVNVPFGYKEALGMIWVSLYSKTVLTNVFLVAGDGAAPRRCRR